jgi:hypothetical protein
VANTDRVAISSSPSDVVSRHRFAVPGGITDVETTHSTTRPSA